MCETVKTLLAATADPNVHIADHANRRRDAVQYVTNTGFSKRNVRTHCHLGSPYSFTDSPLMAAVSTAQVDLVQLLLGANADMHKIVRPPSSRGKGDIGGHTCLGAVDMARMYIDLEKSKSRKQLRAGQITTLDAADRAYKEGTERCKSIEQMLLEEMRWLDALRRQQECLRSLVCCVEMVRQGRAVPDSGRLEALCTLPEGLFRKVLLLTLPVGHSWGAKAAEQSNAETPSGHMYALLHSCQLEQYHPGLIKLVDNLDELDRLSVADFESQGLTRLHAHTLGEALLNRSKGCMDAPSTASNEDARAVHQQGLDAERWHPLCHQKFGTQAINKAMKAEFARWDRNGDGLLTEDDIMFATDNHQIVTQEQAHNFLVTLTSHSEGATFEDFDKVVREILYPRSVPSEAKKGFACFASTGSESD